MIQIKNIRIEENEDKACLVGSVHLSESCVEKWINNSFDATITKKRYHTSYLNNNTFDLWFSVDKKFILSLSKERCDAFVVACLYFSIITGEDIHCETPITDTLFYHLNEYLIPSLSQKPIHIIAPIDSELKKERKYVGTGISCGVDSFDSVLRNLKESIPERFKVTHLTVFNTGSVNFYGYSDRTSLEEWRGDTLQRLSAIVEKGEKVAAELGLGFVLVDTNIPDLYQGSFLLSHTLRNLSAVLATQKMWQYYYYASAGDGPICKVGANQTSGTYDIFTLPLISTGNMMFYSSGAPFGRLQKVDFIADYSIVQKYLNVCHYDSYNCGHCGKCIRTLMELDICGKIDLFKNSFKDVDFYERNKWKYLVEVLEAKESSYYNYQMLVMAKERGFKFGFKTHLFHYLLPFRKLWIYIHKVL